MKIKKFLPLIILILILVLELLPYGAVVSYVIPEIGPMTKTCSCFSLIPFRQGNVSPLVTAILTCIMITLSLAHLIKPVSNIVLIWKTVSLVSIFISIAPVRYLLYSWGSGAISALLIAEYLVIRKYTEI